MNAVLTRALDQLKSFEDIQHVFAKTGAKRETKAQHSFPYEQSNVVTCISQAKDTQLQLNDRSNMRADLGKLTCTWAGATGGRCRPLGDIGCHGGLRGGPSGCGGARQLAKSQSPAQLSAYTAVNPARTRQMGSSKRHRRGRRRLVSGSVPVGVLLLLLLLLMTVGTKIRYLMSQKSKKWASRVGLISELVEFCPILPRAAAQ